MPNSKRDQSVTIYTIAEAAGVHPSTASRALSPKGPARVADGTAKRIRRIASELGYEPNPWAQSLRTNRSLMIGVIVPRHSDGVLAVMSEAAEDRAREAGYVAVTLSSRDLPDEQLRLVDIVLERRVDGLILATSGLEEPLLDHLVGQKASFVLMNRTSGSHPSVHADDELGGYLATRHLISQGHSRIGLVAGPPGFSTTANRQKGYERAHNSAGFEVDESLMVESNFLTAGGVSAGMTLLGSSDPPTAIFAINDATAIGVLAAARDLGLSVPQDVAVIGYNDTEIAQLLPTALSSISIPLREIGVAAVDMLLRCIEGEHVDSVAMPPRLMARASSLRLA